MWYSLMAGTRSWRSSGHRRLPSDAVVEVIVRRWRKTSG
jgi:hypothetical protein